MPREDLLELRGGTAAQWAAADPILAVDEPGWDSTNRLLKVGDGATAWSALPVAFSGTYEQPAVVIPYTMPMVDSFQLETAATQHNGYHFAGFCRNQNISGGYFEWKVTLAAGTYKLGVAHFKGTNRAIATITLDGEPFTTVDGYAAASAVAYTQKSGLEVPTSGEHTLRVLMNTRNASNTTGWYFDLSALCFQRTGPLA